MSKSNFTFIARRYPKIFEAALEAERQVYTKAVISGFSCRQAMELLLNWVYDIDVEYELPYQPTLAAKLRADCFQRDVPPKIIRELEYIRKIGNNAVHDRRINSRETLSGVKFLFHFCQYVVRTYTDGAIPTTFDESIIPVDDPVKVAIREFAQLKALHESTLKKQAALQQKVAENDVLKAERAALQKEIAALKAANKDLPIPESSVSEAETRRLYIDADLKAIGWDISAENVAEYEVDNMPKTINPTGKGYIDYVLWGDDGLPLALVEAKQTCRSAKEGKVQAAIYADCLEKRFGRRPIIFYTNGFETYIWDDQFYRPRRIFGFYAKDELELLVERRISRKDIRKYTPNPAIAGRYYQREAIQRICDTFVMDGESGLTSNRRKALAVMATGSGKTRTAIALVDILMKANWAKRVLFLADRTALVTQAKRSFNDNVGHLTAIDLTKEIEDNTTRLVFSTYPTISNRIDNAKNEAGTVYGVGHFDLIIVDEAHRSIYKKYEDIFHYFDSLVVGLTATPKDETHADTYAAFECENGNPTYFYELDQAIKDGYLVPPKKMKMGTKFLRRGIKYSELTKAEKEKFEKLFAARGEEVPEVIDPSAINRWLFNKDTVIKVLDALMTRGHKVESGDKIGKTIIFAKSQDHADFIQEVFEEQYPEYKGVFAQTISHRDKKYAQDLIDKFKDPKRYPQIAISVDMLETGIDVPEIVNLVLFKPIYSVSKFWQIIGRGTRLCENLFGVEQDKQNFLVFDCFGNCDYFEALLDEESTETGNLQKSVSHRIFELRIQLAEALRSAQFQDDLMQKFRNDLLDVSHELVKSLYGQRKEVFRVRMRLTIIKKYAKRDNWNDLSSDLINISDEIGPLVTLKDKDEKAKLFDALLYKMQLAYCNGDASFDRGKQNLVQRARRLATLSNIPVVRDKMPLITRIQSEQFWKELSFPILEKIRIELRDLMNLLKTDKTDIAYTNFADELDEMSEPEDLKLPSAPANYLDRVRSFVRNNQDYMVIQKLRTNKPITSDELSKLEQLLFDGGERGTKSDFIKATNTSQPIGQFIRSILGLDRNAAMTAFSTFLEKGNLSANQQQFLEIIINNFTINGFIDPAQLYESPYTDINIAGLDGVFDDGDSSMIVSIIRGVNGNAEVA